MKTATIICFISCLFSFQLFSQSVQTPECDIPFNELKIQKDAYFEQLRLTIGNTAMNEEGSEYTSYQKWLQYWEPRIAHYGTIRDYNNRLANAKKETKAEKSLGNVDSWYELGPYNKPNYGVSSIGSGDLGIGVIRGMTIHSTNANKIMSWSPAGGLFYSANKGQNWSNAGSDNWARSGCKWASFAPNNETTWYACSAPGGSYYDSDNSIGKNCGVYRTSNSGVTWSLIADYVDIDPITPANGETAVLHKILIDPNAANVGYLATSLGLFVSLNIDAITPGTVSWTKVMNGAISDIEFRANGSSTLFVSYYASSVWDIAYTTNQGTSWTSVPNQPSYSLVDQVILKVSDNAPNNLYVIQRTPGDPYSSTPTASLYRYDVSTFGVPVFLSTFNNHVGAGRGFTVSNFNANIMYLSRSLNFYKSIDGGLTWAAVANSSPTRYHDDVEYFITPRATCGTCSNEVYVATHGGINFSPDQMATLSTRSNGLGVSKITAASNAFLNPEKIVLGLDHDGSVLSSGIFSANWTPGWETVNGGDGQTPLIDYSNSNYVWTATQNSQPSISSTGGSAYTYVGSGFSSTNDFSVHYAQNQSNPTILYAKKATNIGSTLYEDLLRSDNRGYSSSLIEQISDFKNDPLPVIGSPYFIWNIIPTPNDPNICYVGLGNNVTWDFKLYKNDQMLNPSAAIVKNNWVELNDNNNSSLKAIDNNNPNIAYLSRGGDIWANLQVLRVDYSVGVPVFVDIAGIPGSGGLPNIRVLQIVLEKGSNGGIYAATDAGVYYANNTTLDYTNVANCFWTKLGTNLPNVPATGLEINYQVNKLRVATAGRGIWEHDLFCPSNSSYAFTAAQNTSTFYEAVNQITSTSTIGSSATITYRGGTYVDLNTGFLTTPNSANYSEMFIHPCSYAGNSPGIKAIEQEENTDGSPDNPIKDLGWMSSELELYPNPNDGKFTVSVKTDLQYEVTVFSSMGQLILTIPSTEVRNMEIDLSAFPKGIYLINFSNNHDFKSVKVICK